MEKSQSEYVLKREYGKTPNGNDVNGRWVLRLDGTFLDFDRYRNDLIEAWKLDKCDNFKIVE